MHTKHIYEMELADPCEIIVEKMCRRCGEFKNQDAEFRPGNHVCRVCRNAMVKQWTSANPIRREIIRTKARRSAYIKRMAKRQKTQDNNVDTSVDDPAMQTTTDDEQVAGV